MAKAGRLRPIGLVSSEICHCGLYKDLKRLTGTFNGCERKTKKRSGLGVYSYVKESAFIAVEKGAAI